MKFSEGISQGKWKNYDFKLTNKELIFQSKENSIKSLYNVTQLHIYPQIWFNNTPL